jgi:hypothetical protein
MSSTDLSPPDGYRAAAARPTVLGQVLSGLRQATDWLDERGCGAWWAVVIVALFLAPPLAIALMLFMLATGRLFGRRQPRRDGHALQRKCGGWPRGDNWRSARTALRPSGNDAFDAYKAETLRRLEDEQRAFEEFLGRLRAARDKAEFDQFMDERARRAADRPPVEDEDENRAA